MRSKEFPALALHIARKDWRESRRIIILLTTGLLVPAVMVRAPNQNTEDFAMGLLAGLIAGTSFGYAQYCFLNERQRGTLDTLLYLPLHPLDLVLAKYVSVYSMVLFTVNIPVLVVREASILYVTNAAALFLATLFMAATVMSAKPWAFQLPVWGLLLFVLPTKQVLERYYPAGLVPLEDLLSHPGRLATVALLLTPLVAATSAIVFVRALARD